MMGFWGSIGKALMPGYKTADAHGAIPVPGETTIELPAGKVKLTYQESKKVESFDDDIDFGVPSSVTVEVASASGGGPLEIKGVGFKGMGSNVSTMAGESRAQIGSVEITAPGAYTVKASGALPPDAVEPQILIGK